MMQSITARHVIENDHGVKVSFMTGSGRLDEKDALVYMLIKPHIE